ncbi:hypothetical protein BH23CHL2_BH23CHL2_28600 [soil metagenome]
MTARRLTLIISAMLVVFASGALAFQPAVAERVAPTGHGLFHRLWARTELPVIEGAASRSWIWGETAITPLVSEPNADNTRIVQYFDKGGMQFNPDPAIQIGNPAYVMASPLAYEMLPGQLASGDQWGPSGIGIAGDADDVSGPTYATFTDLRDAPPPADGALLTEAVDRQGNRSHDDRLAQFGVTAAYRVTLPGLDHQIASPFWEFIQSSGPVYEAARVLDEPMFEDQWAMIGLPLTEAYWSRVKLNGEISDVLVQVFERRVLTYTPTMPDGWQVQIANTGRHYVDWRFGGSIPSNLMAEPESLPVPPPPDYAPLRAELVDLLANATGNNAVTVLDIQTGESISINGDRRQLAACTIKIPIMIAVARDISAGKYTAADVEHLVIPAMGPSLTWHARELLRITGDGDVGAGVRRANAIMQSLRVENSILTHSPGYWGEEHGYGASHGEFENWLTTDDLSRMLAGIWNGDGLTPTERNYVLWSLTLATPFLDAAFRAPLPAGTAAFHKIGVLYQPENVWNDAGIVVLERHGQEYAYVVAFMSGQNPSTYMDGYYLNQAANERVWRIFSNVQ